MNTITKLKQWLSKPGNTKSDLAAALGYESSATVAQWIYRNSIPRDRELEIIEIITKKKEVKKNGSKNWRKQSE